MEDQELLLDQQHRHSTDIATQGLEWATWMIRNPIVFFVTILVAGRIALAVLPTEFAMTRDVFLVPEVVICFCYLGGGALWAVTLGLQRMRSSEEREEPIEVFMPPIEVVVTGLIVSALTDTPYSNRRYRRYPTLAEMFYLMLAFIVVVFVGGLAFGAAQREYLVIRVICSAVLLLVGALSVSKAEDEIRRPCILMLTGMAFLLPLLTRLIEKNTH